MAETGTVVRMSRRLPASAPRADPDRMDEIRAGLAGHVPGTPLDELAVQNQQLIAALDEVRAQRDDLARLNAELEETNRGVMALYHQLSDELEETNRGVVALYAELDEKSVQLRGRQRGEEPVPGQRQPRAARPGHRDHRAGPAAHRRRLGPADRRAEPPGRADPRLGHRPAVAGQRPARPGQGGGRPDRAELVRGGPQGGLRPAARHAAAAGHPARGGLRRRGAGGADAALRRGAARPGAAQPADQRDQVHRGGLGPAERAPGRRRRRVHRRGHRHRHPARAARTHLRGVLPGARQPGAQRQGHRPGPAVRPPAGRHPRRRRCGSTPTPGEGSTFTVRLPVGAS